MKIVFGMHLKNYMSMIIIMLKTRKYCVQKLQKMDILNVLCFFVLFTKEGILIKKCVGYQQTCVCAAECTLKYNQVECLEYAYKNGCMYPKEIQPIIVTKILIPKILIPKWRAAVKNRSFSSIE